MKIFIAFSLLAKCGLVNAWPSASGCLCTSDQSCWPTISEFDQLQSQVSQPLVYPLPTAAACYPTSGPSGNCTDVIQNAQDGNWRSSMPGSMQFRNFETFMLKNGTIDACYINTTITGSCGQGSVPIIGVDARSVADIQAAINFAVKYNLKLVVKNTGHDFLGRSAARDSFVVWTHNMKNISYNPSFVSQGGSANDTYDAVTLGAGVQWHEAYDAVNQYGRMMVGAYSAGGSIGAAGGWLAGGGHSALAPTYGLGVDNAIEISVVLSTGEYLTVNNCQHSDLFWALRGGGGSTYGIVTSVTYRTYLSLPVQVYYFQANITNSTTMQEMVAELMYSQTQFTDDGWGGYGTITNQSLSFGYIAPNMTNETATATSQAWTDYALSLEPWGVTSTTTIYSVPSWYEFYVGVFGDSGGDGGNVIITSRLLSRDTVAKKSKEIAQVLIDYAVSFRVRFESGGKVNKIDPDSAGLNPAWRNAVVEVTHGFSWQDGTSSTEIKGMIDQLKEGIQTMYDLTPNDGAYFNEASLFEINWKESFFGSHYSTLKDIKNKYDPFKLFVVAEGVGSDDWDKELTCRV
ncbi:hypothetical protein BU15DRAFT_44331 [Melanogaster broomeanus]|nr:hypothetical protein BU15DRAFT_44331 [Melanogaster broomeanus]